MDETCDDELNGYIKYDHDDGREGNLGKTIFNSMIEGRNEKENEEKNEEGSEEGDGRKNQCWAVMVFTLCYENLIGSPIYIYIYIYYASEN
jgi:hypothetical protein